MKIKILKLLLLAPLLFTSGCGIGEWTLSELYVQKIEGTSKVLYKYDAWGGRDSNANGFIILDASATFKVDLRNELPFYRLSGIPNASKIEGVTHDCYGSCGAQYYKSQPIFKTMKTDRSVHGGISVTTRIFQYRGFSEKERGLERYAFERFKETRDSLFFYNLDDVESMDGRHLDELKIRKGEIYLQQDASGQLTKIIAHEVRLSASTNAIEHSRTVFLTPKNKMMAAELSERGLFRAVGITGQ